MKLILITFLVFTNLCHGVLLRLSKVADGPGEDAERMVLKNGENEEILFIGKKPIVTEKDVKKAMPTNAAGEIVVTLTEDGGAKLQAATSKMELGRDRLAIVLEGKLLIVPTVQAILKNSFVIAGLHDKSFREVNDLARNLSGLPNLPKDETPKLPKPVPQIETEPYTDEEYQQIKLMREKAGFHFLDSMPSKDKLFQVLKNGMRREEVIEAFGRPTFDDSKTQKNDFRLRYALAPEKRATNPEGKILLDGFRVEFKNNKLFSSVKDHLEKEAVF